MANPARGKPWCARTCARQICWGRKFARRKFVMGATRMAGDGCGLAGLGGTSFRLGCFESISAVDSSKAIGMRTESRACVYFLTVWCKPDQLALLIAFTTDVRLLLNSSALPIARPGQIFFRWRDFILADRWCCWRSRCAFIFFLLRLWEALPRFRPFFRMGKRGTRRAVVPDGTGGGGISAGRAILDRR